MVNSLGIDTTAWAATGSAILDTTYLTVIIILFLCLVGFGTWFLVYYLSFNRTVIVRDMIDKGELVRTYRAKQILDDKKVYWWKLWGEPDKLKQYIPLPPDDAVSITNKGKLWCELKRTSDGHCIFLKDNSKIAQYPSELMRTIPEEILKINDIKEREDSIKAWRKKRFEQWKKDNDVQFTFQPLSTSQRTMMVSELRKAEERKGSSVWQNLPQVLSIFSFVIIIVCLLVFWGDIAQPALEGKQLTKQIVEVMNENLELTKEMQQDIQTISIEQSIDKGTTPKQQAPN